MSGNSEAVEPKDTAQGTGVEWTVERDVDGGYNMTVQDSANESWDGWIDCDDKHDAEAAALRIARALAGAPEPDPSRDKVMRRAAGLGAYAMGVADADMERWCNAWGHKTWTRMEWGAAEAERLYPGQPDHEFIDDTLGRDVERMRDALAQAEIRIAARDKALAAARQYTEVLEASLTEAVHSRDCQWLGLIQDYRDGARRLKAKAWKHESEGGDPRMERMWHGREAAAEEILQRCDEIDAKLTDVPARRALSDEDRAMIERVKATVLGPQAEPELPRLWTGAELLAEVRKHADLFSTEDFERMLADLGADPDSDVEPESQAPDDAELQRLAGGGAQ